MAETVSEVGQLADINRRSRIALVPLVAAQLMITLDSTIVSVALPSLQSDIDLSDSARAWAVTAYTLTFGGLLLLGGRLGDLIGRRRALLIGVVGFAAVSAVCGAARNGPMFVGSRACQGASAALIAPSILALIGSTFTDKRERTRAVGVYAATSMSGGALGLIIGGLLTQYLSWRWCMYVNIPIGAVVVLGTVVYVVSPPRHPDVRPDVPGGILATAGMAGVIYGLGVAGADGWGSSRPIGALIIGTVLLGTFVWWQSRTPSPLLPLRLVGNRVSAVCFLALMISAFCTFGLMLGMTFQLQTVLGYSPFEAGMAFLAFVGTAVLSSTQVGRRLMPRMRPGLMMALGLTLFAVALLLATRLTVHSSYWPDVFPPMVVMGFGVGILTVPLVGTVMSAADPRDASVAGALVNTMQQIGGSVGAALLNTVSISAAAGYLASHPDGPSTRIAASVRGFIAASRWSLGIALAGAVIAGIVVNSPSPRSEKKRQEEHAADGAGTSASSVPQESQA